MGRDFIDFAMDVVGMKQCGLPADEDMRALGCKLFPDGPHVQPLIELGPRGAELNWECPKAICSYGALDQLPVTVELPGFDTAGELARWLFKQKFHELRVLIAEHGELKKGARPGEFRFDMPADAQARWERFQQICEEQVILGPNEVFLRRDVVYLGQITWAEELLSDPSTDPDVLADYLRPSVRVELRIAAAGNPSCREEDKVMAALKYPGISLTPIDDGGELT